MSNITQTDESPCDLHEAVCLDPQVAQFVIESLPIGIAVRRNGQHIYDNAAARAAVPDSVSQCTTSEGPEGRVFEVRTRHLDQCGDVVSIEAQVDVSAYKQAQQALFERAYLDEVTGLPNRTLLQQSTAELIATLAPGATFALVFVDIDNFKHINDYYGHSSGDLLLGKMAKRLCQCVRPTDVIARIGGDEFVLLLSGQPDDHAVVQLVERVAERLREPFFIDNHEVLASASFGISLFPRHGRTYDLLRQNADRAMYRAKSGVKGRVCLFDETMERAATARMALEQRLRLAVRDRSFCCAFQPKFDLRSEQIVGVEVLLRWQDEDGTIHAPGEFVGIAVELGLMDEIAQLVLSDTVAQLDRIDAVFGPETPISINIAAKQAADLVFMRNFVRSLRETNASERIIIEITEEAFFAKSAFQTEVLPLLRACGTRVSIDDFGSGYSSLSALADITADEVKIDRSFITKIQERPRSQIVLKAIESIASGLGMSVVAEGIETEDELKYLRCSTSIQTGQGYYFSRPMFLNSRPTSPSEAHLLRPTLATRETSTRRMDLRSVPSLRASM